MNPSIGSIMAAVDREDRPREVAAKAVALARLTGAQVELFHCDAERAYSRQHQYDPRSAVRARETCLAESRRFLDSLWSSLEVKDVKGSVSVACESPLYAGIVHAVERGRPDLVVRGTGEVRRPNRTSGASAAVDANDWELVRACPSPLLLTHGRVWKPQPAIAAAIDLSAVESAELTRSILRTAAAVAKSAGGAFEILHAGVFARPQEEAKRRAALAGQARSAGVEPAAIHLVRGEPAAVLPEFARQRDFDLIVLGALTHRKALTALVGTLTGKLIETLDCDCLLVKPVCARATAGPGNSGRRGAQ